MVSTISNLIYIKNSKNYEFRNLFYLSPASIKFILFILSVIIPLNNNKKILLLKYYIINCINKNGYTALK